MIRDSELNRTEDFQYLPENLIGAVEALTISFAEARRQWREAATKIFGLSLNLLPDETKLRHAERAGVTGADCRRFYVEDGALWVQTWNHRRIRILG